VGPGVGPPTQSQLLSHLQPPCPTGTLHLSHLLPAQRRVGEAGRGEERGWAGGGGGGGGGGRMQLGSCLG
jgi:hypothetical protein